LLTFTTLLLKPTLYGYASSFVATEGEDVVFRHIFLSERGVI
jgi:hypothetical protein